MGRIFSALPPKLPKTSVTLSIIKDTTLRTLRSLQRNWRDIVLRATKQEADALRAERNMISKQIGTLMAKGQRQEAEEMKKKVTEKSEHFLYIIDSISAKLITPVTTSLRIINGGTQ